MWECLVKLPNSSLIEVELESDAALGCDLLEEVCKRLGTLEVDFFGLQVCHRHGNVTDKYWINLRNKLKHQLHSPSYRVDLRVKFFVEPHFILQESTRLLVFNNMKQDFRDGLLRCTGDEQVAKFAAHIAQATIGNHGKYSQSQLHKCYLDILPTSFIPLDEYLNCIYEEHKQLHNVKQKTAVYNTLKIACDWEHYGEEYYDVSADGTPCLFGAGPKGITLYDRHWQSQSTIPYEAVLKATHKAKEFYLQTVTENSNIERKVFKLQNSDASKALYRCVTEMYLFHLCDTVRTDVSSQYCRDLKGTLASIFNENTDLGKRFVFDIQRTLKEANDQTRRQLHRLATSSVPIVTGLTTSLLSPTADCAWLPTELRGEGGRGEEAEEAQEEVLGSNPESRQRRHSWSSSSGCEAAGVTSSSEENPEEDSFLCQICVSRDLNTVFVPCGHAACCDACAARVNLCPICRTLVTHRQQLFLPTRMRHASR